MPKPLDRRVTLAEYRELCEYASQLGITRAFVQAADSASSEYIPPFNT
jgi:putative pyruvate formate lyase activating enzyme